MRPHELKIRFGFLMQSQTAAHFWLGDSFAHVHMHIHVMFGCRLLFWWHADAYFWNKNSASDYQTALAGTDFFQHHHTRSFLYLITSSGVCPMIPGTVSKELKNSDRTSCFQLPDVMSVFALKGGQSNQSLYNKKMLYK